MWRCNKGVYATKADKHCVSPAHLRCPTMGEKRKERMESDTNEVQDPHKTAWGASEGVESGHSCARRNAGRDAESRDKRR